jgi:hypothetical protein
MKPKLEQEAAEEAESSFQIFSLSSAISCSNPFVLSVWSRPMKPKLEQEAADTLRA